MEYILTISYFQWAGLIFGLLYIVSAVKNKYYGWLFSLISASNIAIEDFTHTKLYVDGILQIFYALLAIAGLYFSLNKGQLGDQLRISKLSWRHSLLYFLLALLLSAPIGYAVINSTDAVFPYVNSFVAILSLIATFLLIYKIWNTWIFWIFINIVMVYLYFITGAPLLAVLYFAFLIQSVLGLRSWSRVYDQQRLKFKSKSSNQV